MFTSIRLFWLLNLIQQQQGRIIALFPGEKKQSQCPEVPVQYRSLQFAQFRKALASQADYCVNTSQFQNSLNLFHLKSGSEGRAHSEGNQFSKTNCITLASD